MNSTIASLKDAKSQSPPSNLFTALETSMNSRNKRKFGQHLRPTKFFASKQSKMRDIFATEEPNEEEVIDRTEKLRKKYFGKKVKCISRSRQATILHHYSKYFHYVEWRVQHEELETQYLLIESKEKFILQNYVDIKTLRDIIFLRTHDQGILLEYRYLRKLLFACDNKTSIRIENDTNLGIDRLARLPRHTKKLVKHIKSPYEGRFADFDQLVSFSPYFDSYDYIRSPFLKVLEIKTLQKVYLDLSSIQYEDMTLKDIFNDMEAYNIPQWHITINDKDLSPDIDNYDFILAKVDCLALSKISDNLLHHHEYTPIFPYKFKDLKYLYEKRKKVLEISDCRFRKFGMSVILDRCKSLESLYIENKVIEFGGLEYKILQGQSKGYQSWAHNLKDVVLSFIQYSQNHPTFKALVSEILSQSLNLETFKLFSSYPNANNALELDTPDLTGIESLNSLRHLHLVTNHLSESFESILERLPNLTTFDLVSHGCLDEKFPFQSLSRLKELTVHAKISPKWWTGFLQNVESLKGLEILEIQNFGFDSGFDNLKTLQLVLETFNLFKNVRRFALPYYYNLFINDTREDVLEQIKGPILRIIDNNKHLEELIFRIGYTEFKWSRYVKY